MTDLNELLERVNKATGPDRLIDAYFAVQIDMPDEWNYQIRENPALIADLSVYTHKAIPPCTSSIDAALALVDRLLPDTLRRLSDWEDGTGAKANLVLSDGSHHWANGASIPLAIVAALLSALISKESQS